MKNSYLEKTKSFLQKPIASIASNTPTESRLTNQQRSSSSSSSYSDSQPMRQDVTNQVQQPIRETVTESKLSIPSASQVHGIMNTELKPLIDNLNKLLSEPLMIVFDCKGFFLTFLV